MNRISPAVRRCAFALAMFLLVWSPGAARAQTLYGITFFPSELITINTTTGVGTLVAPVPGVTGACGICFRGAKLYAMDWNTDKILEIDKVTGAVLNTIDIGGTNFNEGDLAFRSDGIGFLSSFSPDPLLRFDITVPSSTPIGGPIKPNMDGLAFNSADVLYGISETILGPPIATLYTIDQTTGVPTVVGPTGLSKTSNGGLAFDASGNLFAALSSGAAITPLYKIDVATGAATLIGSTGFKTISGLAFAPGPPPPPPPPGGGINEGDYPGSKGLANGVGGEGTFGFGRQLRTLQPFLKGPQRDPNGLHRVFNVQHQQPQPTAEAESGLGVFGWGLLGLAILAPAALVFGRRR